MPTPPNTTPIALHAIACGLIASCAPRAPATRASPEPPPPIAAATPRDIPERPPAAPSEDSAPEDPEGTDAPEPAYPTCPVGWQEERVYPLLEFEDTRRVAIDPDAWDQQTVLIEFRRHGAPRMCVEFFGSHMTSCGGASPERFSVLPHEEAFTHDGDGYTHQLTVQLAEGAPKAQDPLAPCVYREEPRPPLPADPKRGRYREEERWWSYVRVLGRLEVERVGAHDVETTIHVL